MWLDFSEPYNCLIFLTVFFVIIIVAINAKQTNKRWIDCFKLIFFMIKVLRVKNYWLMILLFFTIRPKTDKWISATTDTLIISVIFSIVFNVSIMILIKIYRSKLDLSQRLMKRLYRPITHFIAKIPKRSTYLTKQDCYFAINHFINSKICIFRK